MARASEGRSEHDTPGASLEAVAQNDEATFAGSAVRNGRRDPSALARSAGGLGVLAPPSDWRAHPLDGAMLWFDPRTGRSVRFDAPETRELRRVAPRVVMFAITNRCNLACSFCSRVSWAAAMALS